MVMRGCDVICLQRSRRSGRARGRDAQKRRREVAVMRNVVHALFVTDPRGRVCKPVCRSQSRDVLRTLMIWKLGGADRAWLAQLHFEVRAGWRRHRGPSGSAAHATRGRVMLSCMNAGA